jgi:hypothetical protein
MTKITKGQTVEVNGKPAIVIEVTKTMLLVEMDTAYGLVRKGVSRSSVE